MALPSSYTEATFKAYMHTLLEMGGFATALGWSVAGGQYNELVNEALLLYGADDITTISGSASINKIRVAGRVALWQGVLGATVSAVNTRLPDGTSAELAKIHEHARAMLELAKGEAAAVGLEGTPTMPPIRLFGVRYTNDPYAYSTSEDEGL